MFLGIGDLDLDLNVTLHILVELWTSVSFSSLIAKVGNAFEESKSLCDVDAFSVTFSTCNITNSNRCINNQYKLPQLKYQEWFYRFYIL